MISHLLDEEIPGNLASGRVPFISSLLAVLDCPLVLVNLHIHTQFNREALQHCRRGCLGTHKNEYTTLVLITILNCFDSAHMMTP